MKTRKSFQWLMAALCVFAMSNVYVLAEGEKKEDVRVPIPISTGTHFNEGEQRSLVVVPFIAYYQVGAIYISTSAEFSAIAITVENEITGQVWNTTTDISDGMGEICISDEAGRYTVEIVTEYGECFTGGFRL